MALKDWSETAANNDDADAGINWAEGQAPSTVNGSSREMMAVLKKALGHVVNVKDYGATGDGTDESAEIQACLDAAPAGATIVMPEPASSWVITTGITISKDGQTLDYQGDSSINGTGATKVINVTGERVTINKPKISGGTTGIYVGSASSGDGNNARIIQPYIRSCTNGVYCSGISIGVHIEQPDISDSNTNGIRLEGYRHVVLGGRILGNSNTNIWFEGDGSRGFSNQNYIIGSDIGYPASNAAIHSSGTTNYNHILFPNVESGDGAATQAAINGASGNGWSIHGGHFVGTLSPQITNDNQTWHIHGGLWAVNPSANANVLVHDQSANGLLRNRLNNLAFAELSPTALTQNTANYNPTGGYAGFYRLDADVDGWALRSIVSLNPGMMRFITKIGTTNLTLADEHAGTVTEARRLKTGWGGDMVMRPDDTVLLVYDSVTARHRVVQFPESIRAVNRNTTAVGNVGGGADNLITYSLPANALNYNERGVRITAWGTTANNSNPKTVTLAFGGTTMLSTALTVSQAGVWRITAEVFRTGSSAQDYSAQLLQGGTTTLVDVEQGSATETDTAAITIKCTGTVTNGGGGINNDDIVQQGMLVEYMR